MLEIFSKDDDIVVKHAAKDENGNHLFVCGWRDVVFSMLFSPFNQSVTKISLIEGPAKIPKRVLDETQLIIMGTAPKILKEAEELKDSFFKQDALEMI